MRLRRCRSSRATLTSLAMAIAGAHERLRHLESDGAAVAPTGQRERRHVSILAPARTSLQAAPPAWRRCRSMRAYESCHCRRTSSRRFDSSSSRCASRSRRACRSATSMRISS
jgi:hypothetical protein